MVLTYSIESDSSYLLLASCWVSAVTVETGADSTYMDGCGSILIKLYLPKQPGMESACRLLLAEDFLLKTFVPVYCWMLSELSLVDARNSTPTHHDKMPNVL